MQSALGKNKDQRSFWQGVLRLFEQGLLAPFLLAMQPVLHLFLINSAEIYFSEVVRSILISLLWGIVSLSLAYLVTRDWRKASAVASLFIFLFFLFGDLSDLLMDTFGLGPIRADLLILALVAVCMLFWIWIVQKRIGNIGSVNLYFNLLSLLFLAYYGISVGRHVLANGVSPQMDPPAPVTKADFAEPRPDVYYIILDGYGRQDILQALYDFDNSEFLEALRARGFYVAEESSSNYIQTLLSLSSSLNVDYIQSLTANGARLESREDLFEIYRNSKVREVLAQNGYEMISFRSSARETIPNAEIYYDDTGLAYPITPFESILIDHSLARVLLHISAFNEVLIGMPYAVHRNQILSTFERLQEIPTLDGNYFVYGHLIAPHPPFVFDQNGEALPQTEPFRLQDGNYYLKGRGNSRETYIGGYRLQIQYINALVLETVDAILAESETPPIIIIQGDHGPGAHLHYGLLEKTLVAERLGILNAYYFPDQDYTSLYPSISPVNSFRVVLNRFFDKNYELVPDKHYYSPWGYPFDFVEVHDLSLP